MKSNAEKEAWLRELISEESLKSLERRFQTSLVFILFVPVLLTELIKHVEEVSTVLNWGVVVAVLVACYLLIELFGRKLRRWVGRFVHTLILINIAAFIPTFIIMAQYQGPVPTIPGIIYLVSIILLMFLPVLILGILIANISVLMGDSLGESLFPRYRK